LHQTQRQREADRKIAFLASRKDIDDIVEVFAKVAKNIDKLA
jgi:hypothetical protein